MNKINGMNNPARPPWSAQTKLIVTVLMLVGFGYLFYKFSAVIAPVVLAIILAFVLAPLVNRLQSRLKMSRGLAILIVYVVLFLAVGAISRVFFPMLVAQITPFFTSIQEMLILAEQGLSEQVEIAGYVINGEELIRQLMNTVQETFRPVIGTTFGLLSGIVSSIVWVIFIVIISIYLIKDSAAIMGWFQRLVPRGYEQDFLILTDEVNTIWSAFFRGQLLLALIVSVILTAEGLIIGLRFALLMGLLGGLMEFLPSIGHGIWLVTASLLALFSGSTWLPMPNWAFFLLVVLLHVVFTQFDLNYLIPRVIGRSVRLPPFVVILGIVAGAAIAGVMGVVLAAPTISTLRVVGRYVYAMLVDLEPFPDKPASVSLPPPDLHWWKRRIKTRSIRK